MVNINNMKIEGRRQYVKPLAKFHRLNSCGRLLAGTDPQPSEEEEDDDYRAKESSFSFDDDDINEEW